MVRNPNIFVLSASQTSVCNVDNDLVYFVWLKRCMNGTFGGARWSLSCLPLLAFWECKAHALPHLKYPCALIVFSFWKCIVFLNADSRFKGKGCIDIGLSCFFVKLTLGYHRTCGLSGIQLQRDMFWTDLLQDSNLQYLI